MSFRVGDWVQVRSATEILATLDHRGCLDGLPFMPQMLERCEKQFRVTRRAHKLCDTVTGSGARRMVEAVFLDDICDGRAYGGCEMECPIVWKNAWLKPVLDADLRETDTRINRVDDGDCEELRNVVNRNTLPPDKQGADYPVYSCQATQMPFATTRLSVWDLRQYIEDFTSGNAKLTRIILVLWLLVYDTIATAGIGLGVPLRWSYDIVQRWRGRPPYPCRPGKLAPDSRTPSSRMDLGPGDLVSVKSHAEILETLTEGLMNRGMSFHPDMVRYCGRTFRVSKRLKRLVNEKTGQLIQLKNDCIILDEVRCNGQFTKPLLCPRQMSPYWREIWLKRNSE